MARLDGLACLVGHVRGVHVSDLVDGSVSLGWPLVDIVSVELAYFLPKLGVGCVHKPVLVSLRR